MMENAGLVAELGQEHFCANIDASIEHAKIVNAK
jgi:hypothetical protein